MAANLFVLTQSRIWDVCIVLGSQHASWSPSHSRFYARETSTSAAMSAASNRSIQWEYSLFNRLYLIDADYSQ